MDETIKPEAKEEAQEETFELIFRNGALANLKEMAKIFNIPETELSKVVSKSTRLLNLVKNAKRVSFEDEKGIKYYIDLNLL